MEKPTTLMILCLNAFSTISCQSYQCYRKFDSDFVNVNAGQCDSKICIRKCCPLGQSLFQGHCVPANKTFDFSYVPYFKEDLPFCIIDGHGCDSDRTRLVMDPEEDYDKGKYVIQSDGTIFLPSGSLVHSQENYCVDHLDIVNSVTALVCSTRKEEDIDKRNLWIGMIVSMPFLLVTFIVYALLPERNIHGKCLMSYVITLFGAYALLVSIQLNYKTIDLEVCRYVGLTCLFFFMVSFFWMNVMSIDIWWTFSGMRGISGSKRASEQRKFLIYCAYAWGAPLVLVIVVASLTLCKSIPIEAWYNPGMGEGQCWFKEGISTFVFFYLPMAIIIIANVVFFSITAYKIKQVQRDTSMLRKDESKKHSLDNDKQRFNLYVKLLLAMGVNWIMEIISWAVNWQVGSTPKAVWYVTDFCNALYGVFIFFIFVFKRNIWKMLKRRYYTFMGKPHLARGMTQTGYSSRTRGSSLNQTVTSDCKSYVDDTSITLTSQVA